MTHAAPCRGGFRRATLSIVRSFSLRPAAAIVVNDTTNPVAFVPGVELQDLRAKAGDKFEAKRD
jgi:hypothetical protein